MVIPIAIGTFETKYSDYQIIGCIAPGVIPMAIGRLDYWLGGTSEQVKSLSFCKTVKGKQTP